MLDRLVHIQCSWDHRPCIFPADVYGATAEYASGVLQNQRGVNTRFADPAGQDRTTSNLISAIEDEPPALVFIEPISNPLLDIIDVHAVAEAAHNHGARVVVDNTIATPTCFTRWMPAPTWSYKAPPNGWPGTIIFWLALSASMILAYARVFLHIVIPLGRC